MRRLGAGSTWVIPLITKDLVDFCVDSRIEYRSGVAWVVLYDKLEAVIRRRSCPWCGAPKGERCMQRWPRIVLFDGYIHPERYSLSPKMSRDVRR